VRACIDQVKKVKNRSHRPVHAGNAAVRPAASLTAHRRALLDMSAPAPRRCLDCDAPLSWKAVAGGGVVCSTCGPGRNGCRTSWNATYKKHLGAFPNEQTTLEIRATMKNSMKEKRGKRKAAKKSAAAAAPLPQPHEKSPARKKKAPSPSFDSSEEEELRGLGLTQPLLEEEVKQLKDQLEKEKSAGILIGEMRGRVWQPVYSCPLCIRYILCRW
jgi:hypothetical protein